MTMNTRQAGAFTELIHKEEQARERWNRTHGVAYEEAKAARTGRKNELNGNGTQSFGGTSARPVSAQPSSRSLQATQGAGYNGTQQPSTGVTQSGRPHEVFANAVAVGTPRLANQNDKDFTAPQTVTKRVVRQVEVPTTRQVKVPIKTTQIVEVMVPRQVASKKLVEYDAMTEREEEYEEVQSIPSTRQKEVLVKTYVTEPYHREVVVKKTRRVPVPVKRFKEVEAWTTVQVPEQRTIEVDGVRVDTVNETKLVEVEEWHQYEMKPVPTGEATVIGMKDIGTGRRLSGRTTGRVFAHNDPAHQHLANDDQYSGRASSRNGGASYNNLRPQSAAPRGTGNLSQRFQPQSGASSDSRRLGFKVRTSTSGPGKCVVNEVEPGQLAARSGLKPNDEILSANGRQTNSLNDFKLAVGQSKGPLLLQVKRGSDRFVVTLQR
jgi:hypothetical protein